MRSPRGESPSPNDDSLDALTKQQVVDRLQLMPHPEGGYFRETYRSGAAFQVEGRGSRAACTGKAQRIFCFCFDNFRRFFRSPRNRFPNFRRFFRSPRNRLLNILKDADRVRPAQVEHNAFFFCFDNPGGIWIFFVEESH